jgi:hypothetical protein
MNNVGKTLKMKKKLGITQDADDCWMEWLMLLMVDRETWQRWRVLENELPVIQF